jgi:myo-inositol-1(or 4)-monophosphatase
MTASPGALLPAAIEAAAIANELIRSRLPGPLTAPGVAILGEEEGVSGDPDSELLWALDPIDGTANLVHGMPLTGVSLGLLYAGRPVLGVIDLPFLDARYWAVEHAGAYVGDRRIGASRTARLRDAVVAIGDYAVGVDADEKNHLRLALTEHLAGRAQRVRMLGSAAIDLAWVAEGKLDASMTMSNKPWDTAAGVIIAREAGAVVIDQDGSDHTSSSVATIAVAPGVVEELLALVAWAQEEVTELQTRRGA